MSLALYTCLLWLSTSGLWTIQAEDPNAAISTKSPHRDLAPINADFAFSLYKHLVALAPDRNTFISPVSISIALAMLSLGAGGHTRAQLLQGLGFNLTETSEGEIHQSFRHLQHLLRESDTGLEITMGSTLFLDHSLELLNSFLEDIKHYYGSVALSVDFQEWAGTRRQINEYIKNKTPGKTADEFLDPDSPAIPALVSYIFSKGTWTQPSNPERTVEKNFYVNETTTVKVPMMFQSSSVKHLLDPELPCQVVQLDHLGNQTIFFVLPDLGQMDTVTAALSRDMMERWSMSLARSQVHLYIPKVSISGTYDLRDVLEDMGIEDVFTNRANFSGISHAEQLKVSKVIHKAMLQLDEEDMKPAATKGTLELESEPLTVSFNRPFLVMVFDHFTWSSLFLGKVVNPT
ncbi:corticosteroid-binding globulin [Marmota marmota marmota]|uniref:corticosteroid-binding globulin n=1 Tax=Marmota marmota marmota TaxID=9994 RepID=UPI000762B9C6|nr:corticosteroid-binding globulin [Marmota marmota marmota]XP_015350636.1 corticosteroid-binding globulin [Marmota marmota marmota]XP_015350647.1 corticosteroid-binding globulin [Marmota marmota marmota]XP_048655221.1 corticosteroid-binding globulin [Marmota marmota marmota]